MDINSIYAWAQQHFGPVVALAGLVGFVIDKAPTFRRVAKLLRWVANILDKAPVIAEDVRAGDIAKAVQDAKTDSAQ